jgi:hypothetical protein
LKQVYLAQSCNHYLTTRPSSKDGLASSRDFGRQAERPGPHRRAFDATWRNPPNARLQRSCVATHSALAASAILFRPAGLTEGLKAGAKAAARHTSPASATYFSIKAPTSQTSAPSAI